MGVTGLETAFAVALHRAGAARACSTLALLVERMTRRRASRSGSRRRGSRPGATANLVPGRPRRRVGRSARTATRAAPTTPASPARALRGRVLMTVAAGRVAFRQRSFADGGRRVSGGVKLDRERAALVVVDVQEALPQGGPRLRPGRRGDRRRWSQGAEAIGIPIAGHRAVPEGPRGDGAGGRRAPARRRSSRSRRSASRPPRPTGFDLGGRDQALRLRDRGPRLRQPDRPRPARRRASRSTSPRDAVGSRTEENRELGLHKMERAGADADQRRDGAVRAARRAGDAPSSSRSRS